MGPNDAIASFGPHSVSSAHLQPLVVFVDVGVGVGEVVVTRWWWQRGQWGTSSSVVVVVGGDVLAVMGDAATCVVIT